MLEDFKLNAHLQAKSWHRRFRSDVYNCGKNHSYVLPKRYKNDSNESWAEGTHVLG
jgi:hypothetical protein